SVPQLQSHYEESDINANTIEGDGVGASSAPHLEPVETQGTGRDASASAAEPPSAQDELQPPHAPPQLRSCIERRRTSGSPPRRERPNNPHINHNSAASAEIHPSATQESNAKPSSNTEQTHAADERAHSQDRDRYDDPFASQYSQPQHRDLRP